MAYDGPFVGIFQMIPHPGQEVDLNTILEAMFDRHVPGPGSEDTIQSLSEIARVTVGIKDGAVCPFVLDAIQSCIDVEQGTDDRLSPRNVALMYIARDTCVCLDHMDTELRVRIMIHLWCVLGTMVHCAAIEEIARFDLVEHRLPTLDEFTATRDRRSAILLDPDGYCDLYRVTVPTPGVENLRETPCVSAGDTCTMCQGSIREGQGMFVLQPCGHCFHAGNSDCLGTEGGTVSGWLRRSRKCPNCNVEVEVRSG